METVQHFENNFWVTESLSVSLHPMYKPFTYKRKHCYEKEYGLY